MTCGAPVEGSLFRALVENRTGVVILVSTGGRILYASPSVFETLHFEPEEMVGRSFKELLHPDDQDAMRGALEGRPDEEKTHFRLRRDGGSWIVFEGSVENFLEDPDIAGVAVFGREMNPEEAPARPREERRILREGDRLFRTTLDETSVGIAQTGPSGRWLRVNQALCEMLGYTRRELLERTFQEMTHSDDIGRDLEALQALHSGRLESFSTEKRFIRKDYSQVWTRVAASPIRDVMGRILYFVCIIEDISAAKRAEQILHSLSDRETEVLDHLAHGRTNSEIAAAMNFSLSSAKAYVGRVMRKLDASDRTNAAVRAASLGIVSIDD